MLSHTESSRHLHTAASKLTSPPKCAACVFGKQVTRTAPGTTTAAVRDRAGVLRADNLMPGAEVSVDHFLSTIKGRLFTGYDKGSDDSRYCGGCIFVDHASSLIHIEFQSSLSSHDTLRAKVAFEQMCRDSGVVVKKYMSDNGTAFTAKDYTDHLADYHQISKLAGVGAHHHNAQAERAIRTIMSIARTMMIHAGIHWPDMARASLWPMAVAHACYVWNHVPDADTGLSPIDIFTKTRWPQRKLMDLHVWGCPVYVLDKALQDGKKIPRWKPRSERTVYMGTSRQHASTVPLVLNPSTGSLTPQFHVVFDDWFATVPSHSGDAPDFTSESWYKMFGESRFQYVLEDDVDLDNSDAAGFLDYERAANDVAAQMDRVLGTSEPLPVPSPSTLAPASSPTVVPKEGGSSSLSGSSLSTAPTLVDAKQPSNPSPSPIAVPNAAPGFQAQEGTSPERKPVNTPQRKPTRSNKKYASATALEPSHQRPARTTKPIDRLTYSHDKQSFTHVAPKVEANVIRGTFGTEMVTKMMDHFRNTVVNPSVFASTKSKNNPDIFTFDEAMATEHKDEWVKAAVKEINSLEQLKCWEEIPISEATGQVLPGTWVFRVKRAPDGTFKKFKARYCIRGDLQIGDFETYAPVVQFSSVRLFLAWSLMFDWHTCAIDFSNAFIQAELKEPTFIHLPRGFTSTVGNGKACLKLRKSIYGLSVAPRLWFQHLWKALKELGLSQSAHDPCLLYRKDLIVICYVDDLGLQAPNERVIDQLIDNLQKKGFELTREGSFTEYLGIRYERKPDGSIWMVQSGLIDKIIEATGLTDCKPNSTPTTREALGSNPDGAIMTESWNYRSVVGMLLYLSTNTRPDIAFAVSQVARFSHEPRQSHATAVKMIVRYLAGTKDKGVIFKRPTELTVDCYVDADFAGLYNRDPDTEATAAKSRTGYIISVGGCFILCKSQLQSTIALSTSEAEYGALSQAMRTLIPIREVVHELISNVDAVDASGQACLGTRNQLLEFSTRIYEDNSTALSLALNQKVTSRTKHWCVKFHFFWSHLNDQSKNMKCLKVDTTLQRADYLTKGLVRETFENCRKLNQGW